jgi:hypothetical protein
MPKCAYCDSAGPMTREHVIPNFLYAFKRQIGDVIGWNDNVQKMLPGDQVVKDVCADCNNGVLSRLDSYANDFFLKNGLLVQHNSANTVLLQYDYDLLLRWNLKVSFNSARRTGAQAHILKDFIPYILGKQITPKKNRLSFLVEFMRGHKFDGDAAAKLYEAGYADRSGMSNPFNVRVSWVADLANRYPGCQVRANIFGPFKFVMQFFEDDTSVGAATVMTRKYASEYSKAAVLRPNQRVAYLEQGPRTWLEEYAPQIMRAKIAKNLK